ncbi:hypothetical protein SERLA73DRAFT_180432 [Serpula lacrymans var. lacrymans S7.3]|uniref:Uncharacterized protein n=2 Tax=Serpula lacrymans var. lacrymans TaxID=341189 RepID=F8PUL0_SERL3|nr:uncharacterized protein SERLADRAFT_466038 [Serpula lacrymans var. lacrymans S7.9]EGO00045.1 hypothetical protein SERLA73DRAFT_180432 [Serpula lacrymans var. lacrymans S7.3]EGO25613.1 hypothetical protein SERLADRAFT_466038 [Serpula lacrymans var. lacrymans S7.9]
MYKGRSDCGRLQVVAAEARQGMPTAVSLFGPTRGRHSSNLDIKENTPPALHRHKRAAS